MADIVLLIERVGDDLEVSVESDTSPAAPTDSQKARRGEPILGQPHGRSREIKEQKVQRKQHAGGGDTHDHLSAGPHQTMILVAGRGDTVTFKCAKPFVVDVEFDPAYRDSHKPEPRRSPFRGWDNPQTGKQAVASGPFLVPAAEFDDGPRVGPGLDETRPSDYHFYKMTVWSDGLKMDPDWYCDR